MSRRPSSARAGRSSSATSARELLCELLRLFYTKNWVSGTGGGICGMGEPGKVLVAPTGVHKERVLPADLFVVDAKSGEIVSRPRNPALRLSECSPIFCEIIRSKGAGSVMHSHALSAVLAGDLAEGGDRVVFQQLEMLKGIKGATNQDKHTVAIIDNTGYEPDLLHQMRKVLADSVFAKSYCILVRDHGAYIWGADVWETKRHAEIYHFLCEGAVARAGGPSARHRHST
ncbi:MAG: methylthioribulose 1-phosphate dehydratase [Nitrospirae bacterium]|nr:methylthioribulose 1-phosphate dehydratase [Nitrospirota bacterium]